MLFREYYGLICASIGPEVKAFAGADVPEDISTLEAASVVGMGDL
jgi:hypothetical protein